MNYKDQSGDWKVVYKGGWQKGQQKADLKIDENVLK